MAKIDCSLFDIPCLRPTSPREPDPEHSQDATTVPEIPMLSRSVRDGDTDVDDLSLADSVPEIPMSSPSIATQSVRDCDTDVDDLSLIDSLPDSDPNSPRYLFYLYELASGTGIT